MPAGLHDLHRKHKRNNILSITPSCRKYRLFVAHNSQERLQRSQDQLVSWRGVEFGQLIAGKSLKMLPPDVRFKG